MDELKILRGNDIIITDSIIMHQPTIGEIEEFGEQLYMNTFYMLCSIPSDMKSVLWDLGIDFMKISDWEYFISISRNISNQHTKLVFGDLDFSSMKLMLNPETDEKILISGNVIVTETIYNSFIGYLRQMIGYILKREKAANKFTKQILIEEDRQKRENNKSKDYESIIVPMVLSLVNTEEFSYTYKNVFDVTLYQLTKSFYQIQNKKSACALYQGSMSGFVDTKKIKSSNFQWIYSKDKFK